MVERYLETAGHAWICLVAVALAGVFDPIVDEFHDVLIRPIDADREACACAHVGVLIILAFRRVDSQVSSLQSIVDMLLIRDVW